MSKWEYTDAYTRSGEEAASLKAHGSEGWEAWHMESYSSPDGKGGRVFASRLYFKRQTGAVFMGMDLSTEEVTKRTQSAWEETASIATVDWDHVAREASRIAQGARTGRFSGEQDKPATPHEAEQDQQLRDKRDYFSEPREKADVIGEIETRLREHRERVLKSNNLDKTNVARSTHGKLEVTALKYAIVMKPFQFGELIPLPFDRRVMYFEDETTCGTIYRWMIRNGVSCDISTDVDITPGLGI